MKKILFTFVFALLCSCKQEVKKEEQPPTTSTPQTETPERSGVVQEKKEEYSHTNVITENVMVPFEPRFFRETSDHLHLLGFYVGKFKAEKYDHDKKPSYSNKINISINHIKKDSIFGHSVVAGNARPFQGIITKETFAVKTYEPGDDKYDGVFKFSINPNGKTLKGSWIANDTKLAVTERIYTLSKRKFLYDPDRKLIELKNGQEDYEYYENVIASLYNPDENEFDSPESEWATIQALKINASNTELTNADVENLYKGDLEIVRNAIYARHGYSFKNRRMRYFFDRHIDWYMPISTDIRGLLTDLEKKNIGLIKRYEQHAEKYYDYFGR